MRVLAADDLRWVSGGMDTCNPQHFEQSDLDYAWQCMDDANAAETAAYAAELVAWDILYADTPNSSTYASHYAAWQAAVAAHEAAYDEIEARADTISYVQNNMHH